MDKKIRDQLLVFMSESPVPSKKWIKGNRLEIHICKESNKCIRVAKIQYVDCYGSPEEAGDFTDVIELVDFIHSINPYDTTCIEYTGRGLGQLLWDTDWLIGRPGCMLKRRNEAQLV
jgi:hypothetical protein